MSTVDIDKDEDDFGLVSITELKAFTKEGLEEFVATTRATLKAELLAKMLEVYPTWQKVDTTKDGYIKQRNTNLQKLAKEL
jgi:hypothetical protein